MSTLLTILLLFPIWTFGIEEFNGWGSPDEVARQVEFPFLVRVILAGQPWCSGTLLGTHHTLTAAHCLQTLMADNQRIYREGMRALRIRTGDDLELRVAEVHVHPHYYQATLDNNLAVIKHESAQFSDHVLRIQPFVEVLNAGEPILFIGRGPISRPDNATTHDQLMKVLQPVYELDDCRGLYGKELVTRNNLCVGYASLSIGICNHETGGAAVVGAKLAGILSFSTTTCTADRPAVFTLIQPYVKWLEELKALSN